MMTINTKEAKDKELKKAKKFAKSVGFALCDRPTHTPGIKLTTGDNINIKSPIFFEIGEDKFIEIYKKIKDLGIFGKLVLRAIVKSYDNLTQLESNDFRSVCFVKSYNSVDMLQFMYDWCTNQFNEQRINIGVSITKKSVRNIWYSLGGYLGMKSFFTQCLTVTLYEFRRIKLAEENMESIDGTSSVDNVQGLKDPKRYVEFNPCITCKYCKSDSYGVRLCKKCFIDIDENLTVEEVNKIYPSASIDNYGNLHSQYIMSNVHECEYYHERIGSKIKAVKPIIKETI